MEAEKKQTGKSKPFTFTQEELKSILKYDPETGKFYWKGKSKGFKEGDLAGSETAKGYISIKIRGRICRAHRLAWFLAYGEDVQFPFSINHINNVRNDNRLANLEKADTRQQAIWRKLSSSNKTGIKGISYKVGKKKYVAEISVQDPVTGKKKTLFYMSADTIEELIEPLRQARERIHGRHAHHG